MSDSPELLKPDIEVTDSELHIKLGNLKAENQRLQTDYTQLLESSTHITNQLRQEVQELRSQLATERADREEVETKLTDLKQKSAAAGKEFPDAADLLNQLRAKRKKSKTDSADIAAILEILEG